jgi:hypothetical protein
MSGYKLAGLAPATGVISITPSDATTLPATRGLYIGGAGNVAVLMSNGSTAVFLGVPVGTTLNLSVIKVLATGTTATAILALY